MRIKIRNSLNVDSQVNLRKLSPLMKIQAGLTVMWHNTEMYKRELRKKTEASTILRMQQDQRLKEMLLSQIYKELDSNTTLKENGKICESIIVSVDASMKKSLDRVITHSDFLSYEFEMIEENPDIRIAFKDMPYLVRVRKKSVR